MKEGETFPATLNFEKAGTVSRSEAWVRRRQTKPTISITEKSAKQYPQGGLLP
jgi:copper(I)-binding protein